jgi:hypothetical protein
MPVLRVERGLGHGEESDERQLLAVSAVRTGLESRAAQARRGGLPPVHAAATRIQTMSHDHQDMWTPLERALAPFKSLARLNRQSVLAPGGESRQMLLRPERCRVDTGDASGEAAATGQVQIGFSIDTDAYTVMVSPDAYQQDGVWNLEKLRADVGAALQSGALTPDAPHVLGANGRSDISG